MPTGYAGLYIRDVDYRDPKWNEIMYQLGELIRREFLPSQGLRLDERFEREGHRGYHPYGLRNLLSPRTADGWHVDDYKGEEGAVLVFGPNIQGRGDTQNILIFCSFNLSGKVREFFEKLDRFVGQKLDELLPKKEPVRVTSPDSIWTDVEHLRMGRAFDFPQ